jgi:hypothetical protein
VSWKTKYLEEENARLRRENRELLCAILDMNGRRTSAEMLRATVPPERREEQEKAAAKAATEFVGSVLPKVDETRPSGRGWRWIQKQWQKTLELPKEPEEKQEDAA